MLILRGTLPNGHEAIYAMGSDAVFYVCDQTSYANFCAIGAYYEIQGEQDEMDTLEVNPDITYTPQYICEGSDAKQYEVMLYGEYDVPGLSLNTSFDIK